MHSVPSWTLEKDTDVVRCRVDPAEGQAVICIELVSRDWPLSIIQCCEEGGVLDAIETWRELFLQRGWMIPGTVRG